MGDLVLDRTLQLIRDQIYWPKMEDGVRHFVSKACSCVKRKRLHVPVAPMQSIQSSATSELIGMDFLHLNSFNGGYQYLLVLTDHQWRFMQVHATTNKSTKTAEDRLYNELQIACLRNFPNFVDKYQTDFKINVENTTRLTRNTVGKPYWSTSPYLELHQTCNNWLYPLLLNVWLINAVTDRPDYANCYRYLYILVRLC